jgi:hypothetical protein
MTNPILESLITDIMVLGEKATAPTRHNPGDVWPTKGGFGAMNPSRNIDYFKDKKDANAFAKGRIVGKAVEPSGKGKKKPADKIGSMGGVGKKEPQAQVSKTKDVIAALSKKIDKIKDPRRKEVLQSVMGALQSGDPTKIQEMVDKYELFISPEGKLKSRALGDGSDEQKLKGDDKDFARFIYDLAKEAGVEIPGGGDKADVEADKPSSSVEQFKPSRTFSDKEPDKLDVEVTETGITVEGIEIEDISSEKEQQTEDNLVERARQRAQEKGQEFTSDNENRIRAYVRKTIAATKHNILYLRRLAESGQPLPAYQFEGDGGRQRIVGRLVDVVSKNVPDAKKEPITSALEKMGSAKTVREFNSAYEEFAKLLKGTPANAGKKYLAETITALRVVALGGVALIPQSDSFPLADVLALRRSPITGEIDIDQLLVDIDEDQEITAAGSVKDGLGAGSGNFEKIVNSRFNVETVDGVDCKDVPKDLADLCGMRNSIFKPTENGDVPPEAKKQLTDTITKYGPIIKAYYGLSEDMSDEEMYQFLSYGRELSCVDGQPQPTPDGLDGKPYKKGQSENGGQWRAWSVLGKVTDAIHNRTVEQQYYHTVRYNGVIKVADGIRTLSKMKAQHLKNAAKMKGGEGFTKPDQELNGYTIPASIEEVRNGNPCTE